MSVKRASNVTTGSQQASCIEPTGQIEEIAKVVTQKAGGAPKCIEHERIATAGNPPTSRDALAAHVYL